MTASPIVRWAGLALAAAVLLVSRAAHGDAEEWRLDLSVGGTAVTLRADGADGRSLAWGGGVGTRYGVTNGLDLGVEVAGVTASSTSFAGAAVEGHQGDLYASLLDVSLAATLDLHAGVGVSRLLERTQPFVRLRAGVRARRLADEELLMPDTAMLIARPGAVLDLAPFAGAAAGVSHRFGAAFTASLELEVIHAGRGDDELGLRLAVGWSWY